MNSLFITTIKYNNKKFYLLNNNIILKPSYDENEILNIKHSAADEFNFKINRLQLLNAIGKMWSYTHLIYNLAWPQLIHSSPLIAC